MSDKKRFWRIDCEEGIKKISSMIISTNQILDKRIEELIKMLFAKYILKDEEILSSLSRVSSSRYNNLIRIQRYHEIESQTNLIRISYVAQSRGISIKANLIYENELTEIEKIEMKV